MPICLAFLTSGSRLFHSFIQYGKNVFLKVFDLEGMGFILVVDADLKGCVHYIFASFFSKCKLEHLSN